MSMRSFSLFSVALTSTVWVNSVGNINIYMFLDEQSRVQCLVYPFFETA